MNTMSTPRATAIWMYRALAQATASGKPAVSPQVALYPACAAPGQFSSPESVDTSVDGSQVYVADTSNHRVQQFNARGQFLRQWGAFGAAAGRFNRPVDLAVAD